MFVFYTVCLSLKFSLYNRDAKPLVWSQSPPQQQQQHINMKNRAEQTKSIYGRN